MAAKSRFSGSKHIVLAASSLAILMSMSPAQVWANNGGVDRDKKELSIEAQPTADEALARFTTNVTQLAKEGKLPPFVGERTQIREVQEVIEKQGTKVVYILGEAGSGKTAMIEQTAGQLDGLEMFRLNLNSLEAGTGYRGMLEDRLEALLQAFKGHPERVLFIDEIHVAARMPDFMDKLKPAMARGEINLIGATTEMEYREFIEKDVALTSRASVFYVTSPNEEKVLTVLRANRKRLAEAHKIQITDSALTMTARLVVRYFADEPALRKSLDIIDRAASRMKLSQRLGSMEMLALQDRKEALELQVESVDSDIKIFPQDQELRQRKVSLRAQLEQVQDEIENENASKMYINLEVQMAELEKKQKDLQLKGEFGPAAKLQNEDIPRLRKQMTAAGMMLTGGAGSAVLTEDIIVKFVGRQVGDPNVGDSDLQRLQRLATAMNQRVLGQPEAVNEVIKRLKIRMTGVESVKGPQAVILMDGPTGVGKSEMMKAITATMFGDEKRVIRVNVNSLGHHFENQLFGQGVGIVDSDKGGKFDDIRRRPFTVVSFDEFDKAANPEFYTSLLQILDEGITKDAMGRTLDFRNSVIVMQANFTGEYSLYKDIWSQQQIEQRFRMEPGSLDGLKGADRDSAVLDAAMAMKGIPPEVRNRIAAKLVFNGLDIEKAIAIAMKNLADQRNHIWKEKGIQVDFDTSVALGIAYSSFDPTFGARPVLQQITNVVSDMLADLIVQQKLKKGDKVALRMDDLKTGKAKLVSIIREQTVSSCEVALKTSFDPKPTANMRKVEMPFDMANQADVIERASRATPRTKTQVQPKK